MLVHDAATAAGVVVVPMVTLVHWLAQSWDAEGLERTFR